MSHNSGNLRYASMKARSAFFLFNILQVGKRRRSGDTGRTAETAQFIGAKVETFAQAADLHKSLRDLRSFPQFIAQIEQVWAP